MAIQTSLHFSICKYTITNISFEKIGLIREQGAG